MSDRPATRLKSLLLEFSTPVPPSSARLYIHGHGHVDPIADSIPFSGIATNEAGNYVCTVRGTLPIPGALFCLPIKPKRRIGRPSDEGAKVAICLHERMIMGIHQNDGRGIKQLRVEASKALGFDGENAERNFRRDARTNKAAKIALKDHLLTFTFVPEDPTGTAVAIAVHPSAIIEHKETGLQIKGDVWICRWCDKRARFGSLDCTIPGSFTRARLT